MSLLCALSGTSSSPQAPPCQANGHGAVSCVKLAFPYKPIWGNNALVQYLEENALSFIQLQELLYSCQGCGGAGVYPENHGLRNW